VRYAVELAAGLRDHPDVELTVMARKASGPFFGELLGGRGDVVTVPDAPTAIVSTLERHGPALGRARYDVVHGTKHLLPRRTPSLRMLTVHDMTCFDRPRDFGILKRQFLRGPYLASARQADVLVCNSDATRARLCSYLPSVAGRTTVIPLAVSNAFRDTAPSPSSAWSIGPSPSWSATRRPARTWAS
jgi:hypothetical protein